jgi:DNA-binding response OmpR family regulator
MNALDGASEKLIFVADEGYFIWDGRELYPTMQELALFRHLLAHHGEWCPRDLKMERAIWPARSPDTKSQCLTYTIGRLASKIVGTSMQINRRRDFGYRLMGEVEVI